MNPVVPWAQGHVLDTGRQLPRHAKGPGVTGAKKRQVSRTAPPARESPPDRSYDMPPVPMPCELSCLPFGIPQRDHPASFWFGGAATLR